MVFSVHPSVFRQDIEKNTKAFLLNFLEACVVAEGRIDWILAVAIRGFFRVGLSEIIFQDSSAGAGHFGHKFGAEV